MTRVAVLGASASSGARSSTRCRGAVPSVSPSARPGSPLRRAPGRDLPAELARRRRRTALAALRDGVAGMRRRGERGGRSPGRLARLDDGLFGANALLPPVRRAARRAPERPAGPRELGRGPGRRARARRVRGRYAPFSPYSASKALGEQAVCGRARTSSSSGPPLCTGRGRAVTRSLARVAVVAGGLRGRAGRRPTPQVLVHNVADAVAFVALTRASATRRWCSSRRGPDRRGAGAAGRAAASRGTCPVGWRGWSSASARCWVGGPGPLPRMPAASRCCGSASCRRRAGSTRRLAAPVGPRGLEGTR